MWKILKQAGSDFADDKCTRMAAALAYYTAFAMAPMLVLIISVAQIAFEPEDLRGVVRSEVESVVGPQGAEQIETMLDTNRSEEKQSWFATIVSGIVLIVGATGMFAQMQAAMNDVWEVKPNPDYSGIKNFIVKRITSLGMILTIAFLIMVSITASSVLHAYNDVIDRWVPGPGSVMISALDYGLSLAVLTVMFAAMFRFLPDARVEWKHVWIGAFATALLFLLGKFGIAIYVANTSTASSFGAAGSLVVILMWVYYSMIIVLFGAEFTQAWAKQRGRGILPEPGAVRVVTSIETYPQS